MKRKMGRPSGIEETPRARPGKRKREIYEAAYAFGIRHSGKSEADGRSLSQTRESRFSVALASARSALRLASCHLMRHPVEQKRSPLWYSWKPAPQVAQYAIGRRKELAPLVFVASIIQPHEVEYAQPLLCRPHALEQCGMIRLP